MKYVIATFVGMAVIAVVFRASLLKPISTITGHNDVTLTEGLQNATAFVDSTIEFSAADLHAERAPSSADASLIQQLKNNYSLSDHSFPYQGYNDCDGWKNLIFDGWSAMYRVEIEIQNKHDAERLVLNSKRFWESRGFEVESIVRDHPSYTASLFIPGFQLHANTVRNEASITAWTPCLPPR